MTRQLPTFLVLVYIILNRNGHTRYLSLRPFLGRLQEHNCDTHPMRQAMAMIIRFLEHDSIMVMDT